MLDEADTPKTEDLAGVAISAVPFLVCGAVFGVGERQNDAQRDCVVPNQVEAPLGIYRSEVIVGRLSPLGHEVIKLGDVLRD